MAALITIPGDEATLGEAISVLRQALREELTDPEAAPVVAALARAFGRAGDAGRGVELIEGFLARSFDPPLDPALLIELHAASIELYLDRGNLVLAEGAAAAALSLSGEGGSPEVLAETCWRAGQVFAQRGKWEAALELADRARCLLVPMGDRIRVAELHRTSASLCLQATPPRLDEAGHHLQEAEAALAALDRPIERSRLHLERAHLALLQGHAEDALAHARAAQSLAEPGGLEQARSVFLQGRALAASGRHREARRALEEAAERYGGLGAARDQARCHRELGELAVVKEDWRGAAHAFRRALKDLDSG